ncbi:A disintegrin and metalloproteinase with thrombospondin motifs 1-like isoform X3 [Dermacentor silvarum]|uniref:A disintegrin and metalloproteinase with thrombospondin motifs 1-like isoform X3 n=1 Tax=Dermacentor silvarum TaxID=543639 RepID=UPI0021016CEA|nr:A disintegrin and metalloproteinase with thrombospondin motifs 1-like isoform X3 [Dermacentor silvarum]
MELKWFNSMTKLSLNLVPSDVFSDTFVLSTARNRNLQHKEVDTTRIRQTIYHDETSMAAISMQDVEGIIEMTGIIGERLRIEPLPFAGRTLSGVRPHRLFYARNIMARDDVEVSGTVNITGSTKRKRFQRYSNYAVLELYIIIDVLFSKRFPKDADAINYLAVTVASLEDDFVMMDGDYMDGQATLTRLVMFCYTMGLHNADIRYFITGRDITGMYNGRMNAIMGGYAYVGGLCSLDGVALGEDKPGLYAGVDIMAHELAHSLGCVHDGEGPRSEIPGHAGSIKPECAAYLGYLMSYSGNNGKNHYHFSPCCQAQIKLFLRLVSDECIQKTFQVTQIIPGKGFLPGHWISPHRYCVMKQPKLKIASATTLSAKKNCKLPCQYLAGSFTKTVEYDALDGMPCEQGRWCENGVCL